MADLPLAVFLSLALLSGAGWLATGGRFYLGLVVIFGAAATAIKGEGLAEVVLLLALLGLFAPRRRAGLWLAGAAVTISALPWLLWRLEHAIDARVPLGDALDPSFLADRTSRLSPALGGLVGHLVDPTEWLLLVPLALVLSLTGFARERRACWLAFPAALATVLALLAWGYWADRDDIDFLVATSAYRVVDPLLLTAALAIPLLAERILGGTAPGARVER